MARAELAFLQVDIVGHSRLDVPDSALHDARRLLEQYVLCLSSVSRLVVSDQTGRAVFWAGDGGWIAFDARNSSAFAAATNAALDLYAVLPRINTRLYTAVGESIRLRVSVDSMVVEMGGDIPLDLSHLASAHLNAFLKNERELGLADRAVLSNRIYQQLTPDLKAQFKHWKDVNLEKMGATKLYISVDDGRTPAQLPDPAPTAIASPASPAEPNTMLVHCYQCGHPIGRIHKAPGSLKIGCPKCRARTDVRISSNGSVDVF